MNFEKEKRVVCSCSCVPFMEGVPPLSYSTAHGNAHKTDFNITMIIKNIFAVSNCAIVKPLLADITISLTDNTVWCKMLWRCLMLRSQLFTLDWIAFAPARKPYRIGLLFTDKNWRWFRSNLKIAVTDRSCAAPGSLRWRVTQLDRCSC